MFCHYHSVQNLLCRDSVLIGSSSTRRYIIIQSLGSFRWPILYVVFSLMAFGQTRSWTRSLFGSWLGVLGRPRGGIVGRLRSFSELPLGFFGASWLLGSLGGLLGPPGIIFGALGESWGHLGAESSKCPFGCPVWAPSWGRLAALLGRLGALLETLWAVSGRSWGLLGPSWSVERLRGRERPNSSNAYGKIAEFCLLGPSGEDSEASWGVLGASWGVLGASWAVLERSWPEAVGPATYLAPPWGAPGALQGPQGRAQDFWHL